MDLIYSALIPSAAGSALLLERSPAGWALPEFRFAEPHFWQDVAPLNAAIRARFGLAVWTLRCLTIVDDDDAAQSRFYYLHELQPGAAQPGPAEDAWVAVERLDALPFAHAEQRDLIRAWLDRRREPPGPNAVPWYRPGWAAQASGWIAAQLSGRGLETAVIQQRSWGRSAIWRAAGSAGQFYFKAVPAMFAHEVALTAAFPELFAPVLASDPRRGWLLMPAAGTEQLSSVVDIDSWIAAIKHYAAIQIALVPQAERLLGLGLPDQRLPLIQQRLEGLFSESGLREAGLNQAESADLLARKAELAALLAELAALPIPATIEHGDFWPGQIVLGSGSITVIDWSDSSLGHPFFSLHMFMARLADYLPDIPDAAERLIAAYLAEWGAFAPPATLHRALELALRLAPLHHALLYAAHILPAMEFPWEMEPMLTHFLRLCRPDQLS